MVLSIRSNEDLIEDVYEGYHNSQRTGLFDPTTVDKRLDLKEIVIGVRLENHREAYPLSRLDRGGQGETDARLIQDHIGQIPVLVYHDPNTYFTAVYDRRSPSGFTHCFPEETSGNQVLDAQGDRWNILTGEGPNDKVLRRIPHVNIYWFAWVDFYPETEIFKKKSKKGARPRITTWTCSFAQTYSVSYYAQGL